MTTSANPLIVSCGGESETARAAEALATELVAAGVGTRDQEPTGDRPLIVVDGCAAACGSRRVESLGLVAAVTVDAAAVRSTDDALSAVRSQLRSRRPRRHRGRPQPPAESVSWSRAHTVRDYLIALDALTAPIVDCGVIALDLPAVAAHVSRLLGVSRPSAGEMLDRLEDAQLIARTPTRQIVLTSSGRAAADEAVRRHRLLERFAVDYLGYGIPECFERARAVDGAFDDDAVERLAAALGRPERCPHGWPIDAARARAEAPQLRTLSALTGADAATVVAIEERSPALLRELVAHGIVPGAIADAAASARLSPAARAAALVRR